MSPDQQDIDQLAESALAAVTPDLSALQAMLDSSTSYEDLQARLRGAYGSMDMGEFRTILERALFMAELKGRSIK